MNPHADGDMLFSRMVVQFETAPLPFLALTCASMKLPPSGKT